MPRRERARVLSVGTRTVGRTREIRDVQCTVYTTAHPANPCTVFRWGEGVALFATGAGAGAPIAWAAEAASRGAEGWKARGGGTLSELLAAASRAVRQAGEALEAGRAPEGDGFGFTPDPASPAFGLGVEVACVRRVATGWEFAAVGRAAVVRRADGAIVPLHPLDNLAASLPAPAPEMAHRLATRLIGGVHLPPLHLGTVPDEPVFLLSPAVAVQVVSMGVRPPEGLDERARIAWLLARCEDLPGAVVACEP